MITIATMITTTSIVSHVGMRFQVVGSWLGPSASNIAAGRSQAAVNVFTCRGADGIAHPVVTGFGALVVE